MNEDSKLRVIYLDYHQAPYRTPTIERIKSCHRFAEFLVLRMFGDDVGHSYWGLKFDGQKDVFLGDYKNLFGKRAWHRSIRRILEKEEPDCIVANGIFHITSLYFILYGLRKRVPIVLISDNSKLNFSSWIKSIQEKIKVRVLDMLCRAFWVPGKAGERYLRINGNVSSDKIFHGAYVLNDEIIKPDIARLKLERSTKRAEFGFKADDIVFLMAANFIPTREHELLVKAFLEVHNKHPRAKLILLGEGECKSVVESFIIENKLNNAVKCPGGVPFESLANYYSFCDVYVHSGCEPYSTALAYAAMAGLPLLSTREIGVAEDVLVDGQNGYFVESGSVKDLVEAMVKLTTIDEEELISMSVESQKIGAFLTVNWAAKQLESAILCALGDKCQAAS